MTNQIGDPIQIAASLGTGQDMSPAVGKIVVLTTCGDPGLDVVGQQAQLAATVPRYLSHLFVVQVRLI